MKQLAVTVLVALLFAPALAYGQKGELTREPRLVEQTKAEYTEEAVEEGVEGEVVLRLLINADGEVEEAEVREGLGHGLDEAAVEAAEQFVFEPAEIDGRPAPVTLDFAVEFTLPERPSTFRGKVVDEEDEEPIDRARVSIEYTGDDRDDPPSAQMRTGSDGAFSFEEVPPGPYRVELEAPEYQKRSADIELGSDETIEATYRFSKHPVNLRGEVLEAGTREPLAGIRVRVYDDGDEPIREEYTDGEGTYAFHGLEPGEYRVELDAEGYDEDAFDQEVVEGEVTSAKSYLKAEYYDEYTVKTTAEREEREVNRQRISRDEIRQVPGSGGDVVRSVQNMPGVARPSFVGGDIIVRGAAPEDTEVFLQGDSIPLVFHFLGGPAVVSSEMLDAVDFYPGNFSSYYGRATGGIVSLDTRSPRDDRFHGFTEIDLLDATAQFEGPISDEVSVAVSARRSYVDAFLSAIDEVGVAPRYYDYQGWLTWRASDDHKLELFLYGSDDSLETTFDEDEVDGGANVQFTGLAFDQSFHRAQARWEWTPEDADVENEVIASIGLNHFGLEAAENLYFYGDYYQSQFRDDLRIDAADNLELRLGADVQVGNVAYDLEFPRTEDGAGGGGDQAGSPSEGLVAERSSPLVLPAAYTEAEYEPVDGLKLIPGLRLDYYGPIDALSTSPRFSTRWRLSDALTAKGGVGLFTQPPLPNQSEPDLGNPNLTFEKAMHYAAGTEWEFGDDFELDATLFYRDLFDLVETSDDVAEDDSGELEEVIYDNSGLGHAYGLELLVRHYPRERFFGWIAYTLSRAERFDDDEGEYVPFEYDQTHIFTAVAGYKLPWNVDASARFRYVTGTPMTPVVGSVWDADSDQYEYVSGAPNSDRAADFHQLDVRFEKQFVFDTFMMGAYLEVINAYNAKNEEGRLYNYDASESEPLPGLPIIPTLGVNGRF
ncbi:MAG: TonB-dependent receptor domain-containing protein [Persicimonas sp.]